MLSYSLAFVRDELPPLIDIFEHAWVIDSAAMQNIVVSVQYRFTALIAG